MSSNIAIQRICKFCQNTFTARTTVTQYCSTKCASKASKLRKRQSKIAQSDIETGSLQRIKIEELNAREFLTVEDVCLLTKVSRWTVWRAIKSRRLRAGKIGRRVLIRRRDLDAYFFPEESSLNHGSVEVFSQNHDIEKAYSMSEIKERYGISDKALRALIERNNLQVIKRGRFTFVSKTSIDKIFNL